MRLLEVVDEGVASGNPDAVFCVVAGVPKLNPPAGTPLAAGVPVANAKPPDARTKRSKSTAQCRNKNNFFITNMISPELAALILNIQ